MALRPTAEARRRARALIGRLDRESLRRIAVALRVYADALAEGVLRLPADRRRALAASVRLTRALAAELERALLDIAESARGEAYQGTLQVYRDTLGDAAATASRLGVPVGTVRVPAVTMLGAFERLNAAGRTWRTAITTYVGDVTAEMQAVIRIALANDVGPVEMARRLRRYVQGAESFQSLFRAVPTRGGTTWRLNLTELDATQRLAAQKLRHNAERIAFTETHLARMEAELEHFRADPLVKAVRRVFAPDRGTRVRPCACDSLNRLDWFGLGPGVYPVDRVPPEPHPWGRCELVPVEFRARDLRKPPEQRPQRPTPPRLLDPATVPLIDEAQLTPAAARHVRQHLVEVFGIADSTARAASVSVAPPSLEAGPQATATRLYPRGESAAWYTERFRSQFGLQPGQSSPFTDALGDTVMVSDRFVTSESGYSKANKRDRGPTIALASDVLLNPAEIWEGWVEREGLGRVYRRHYLGRYLAGDQDVAMLAAFTRKDGRWEPTTLFGGVLRANGGGLNYFTSSGRRIGRRIYPQ